MADYKNNAGQQLHESAMQGNQNMASLLSQLIGGKQKLQQQTQDAQNQAALAQMKDQMGQEGTTRNMGVLNDFLEQHPGMGGSVGENGNVAGSPQRIQDPMEKQAALQQAQQMKTDTNAQKGAVNYYNKNADKVTQQLGKFDNIMNSLNSPNAVSGGLNKTEIINALGMVRYNDKESSAIYGPTYQNLYSKVANALGGNEGSLSPSQISGTKEAIADMYKAAQDNHAAIKAQALATYSSLGGSNQDTLQNLDQNISKGFDTRAATIDQKYGKDFQAIAAQRQAKAAQAQAQQQAPVQPQSMAQKAGSWLSSLIPGSGQQPAPSGMPVQAPGSSPSGVSSQDMARLQQLRAKQAGGQ
jgi:hypothetical protein